MAILNYTTKVPTAKTVMEIQNILVKHGALAVLSEYDQGVVSSIAFKSRVGDQELSFRLPCEWQAILTILERDSRVSRSLKTQDQAVRISWRIIKDWIEAQMALIETKMVTLEQVFLPYTVMPGGRSLYSHIKESGFLLTNGEGA